MPGKEFSAGSGYRYGFNGKENDKDAGAGIQDYGMRIFDVRLGRFLSVDPITVQYPELTPYQFASNTPLQATDLDGLEAFFVHGTTGSSKRWGGKDGKMNEGARQLFRLQPSKYYNIKFNWGGFLNYGNNYFNDVEDRKKAAKKLVKYIMKNRVEGEDITMLAH